MNIEGLLELATSKGASVAEVYQVRSKSRSVFFEANRLKQLDSTQEEGLALRIWQDDRPGLAVGYGEIDGELLVDKAIAISQFNPPEAIDIAEKRHCIYPEVGQHTPVEDLVKLGTDAIDSIRQAYPEVICSSELESEQETTTLANSRGLYCEYSDISLSYSLGVEWIRGEDFLNIYDGEYTREKLNVEKMTRSLIQRLDWAKVNTKITRKKTPIIFTPNAATMLWETVVAALNGKLVVEGTSPWSEQKGKQIMSTALSISQQPNLGVYSCPMDDEGTPTQNISLVEEGVLQGFYGSRQICGLLGIPLTGNGFRPGLGRYPTPALINFIVSTGKGSFLDLVADLPHGLIIDQFLGEGADLSGDFSINVDLGYRIHQGKIVGRIKDTMVSGNIYTALQQLVALGGDPSWSGSCYTPSIVIDGLSVVS